jgi:mannose/cellobiose epimerase-like protein (N-acyl-D-glucosamine 2-epimerase family)
MTPDIDREASTLTAWLVEKALPLWATNAADPAGGYFELLDIEGTPVESPRRCYVAARQVYVFAVAAEFGWNGSAAADRALDFLTSRFSRGDGLYASVFDPVAGVRDDFFDLYDHAFVIFALATVAARSAAPRDLEDKALLTLEALRRGWSHPACGFEEAVPRKLPLRANPHMHLFEAALAWLTVPGVNPKPWTALADELGKLCLDKFIDPATGALHEFYGGDWQFADGYLGRIVEPGHQFEWAWLLVRWGKLRDRPDALEAARTMAHLAEQKGVIANVAINELWDDLTIKDPAALLWPQTERIKAWVALALASDTGEQREKALAAVADASASLRTYLQTPVPGLWFKERSATGTFSNEPVLARYLYHIVCAIQELQRLR